MPEHAVRRAVQDIGACVAAGACRPQIAMALPLERIAEAHEAQESGETIGKILIELQEAPRKTINLIHSTSIDPAGWMPCSRPYYWSAHESDCS